MAPLIEDNLIPKGGFRLCKSRNCDKIIENFLSFKKTMKLLIWNQYGAIVMALLPLFTVCY